MLIEVHIIQNHAPSNLNRDDSGSPKSAIFGGYRRARISSQCLKRCYRTSKMFCDEVDNDLGMHSSSMPEEVIRRAIIKGAKISDKDQKKLVGVLVSVGQKRKDGGGGASSDNSDQDEKTESQEPESQKTVKKEAAPEKLKTAQSLFWRQSELDALADGIKDWADGDKKKEFDTEKVLKSAGLNWVGIPVDMALFGRMVTSDLMHNVEASSQFAHAISTHEFTREFDFWTCVDDRRDKRLDFYDAFGSGEKLVSGADCIGDAEFTSACYYSYFNVDFCALVDNLTGKALKHDLDDSGDREKAVAKAKKAVVGLLKAAIFERPTGKFNSMATPSLPSLVLVEIRDNNVPVSYVDAFAKPVDPKNEETLSKTGQVQHVGLADESARRLIKEANRITKAFCRIARNRLLFTGGHDFGVSLDCPDIAPFHSVDSTDDLVRELTTSLESWLEEKDV